MGVIQKESQGLNVLLRSATNAAQTLATSGEYTLEEMKTLHVSIPAMLKDVITADSKALGIPACKLYPKILEDFVYKTALERKKIYTRRKKRGSK